MGAGCGAIRANAGLDAARRPDHPRLGVGRWWKRMPSPNARPIRSASNPAFVRSRTAPTLKIGRRTTKKNLRSTSEEIATGISTETRISRPNYSLLRERLLRWTPPSYHCRLFCGGAACKYCDPNAWAPNVQAVPGLFSTWVTDDILATSRPTTTAIKRFDLFNAFKARNIVSVMNLQRPYEHSQCGPAFPPKLEFAYDPEDFMKREFFHYNFGWPDFGASTVACLLDMVKVLEFALTQGKVAIHCHAGLGRTGVLICAFLLWDKNYSPTEAIQLVRNKRPGSVQTTPQVDLLMEFHQFLSSLRPIFDSNLTFQQHLKQQQLILHGMEARLLKHIPKIVFVCCERLLETAGVKTCGSLSDRLRSMPRYEEKANYEALRCIRSLSVSSSVEQERHRPPAVPKSNRFSISESDRLPPLLPSSLLVKAFGDEPESKPTISYKRDPEKWRCVFDSVFRDASSDSEEMVRLKEGLAEKSFASRWDVLATETSSENLLFLLRDWFMSLKEPAIPLDFQFNSSNAKTRNLPKGIEWTIFYCASVFNKIGGGHSDLTNRCARYMAACLTGQKGRNVAAEDWFSATIACFNEATQSEA